MDARNLIETLKARGLNLRVNGDRIRVEAPQEPDSETKALLDEVRRHQDEIKAILMAPLCWNCGQAMVPITDINGKDIHYCQACEVSSEDMEALPHLPQAWKVKEIRSESGEVQVVLICSGILQDHLWVVYDRSFEPKDTLAIYYAEELPHLKARTSDDLRQIHRAKLAFPGSRIIQDGDSQEGKPKR